MTTQHDINMFELGPPDAVGNSVMHPKIIFIHGMFLTPRMWVPWMAYFEKLGYRCEAPAWPLHDGEPVKLRQDIPPGLGSLTLSTVYRHYAAPLMKEESRPIVVGHGMGGLLMQKLAASGLIRAGVGISPVAPNGKLTADWGFIRNSAHLQNPFAGNDPCEITADFFRENFGNAMSEMDSAAAFQRHAVPESRQIFRDVMGEPGEVDLERPHPPLLFVGASEDEVIPSKLVAATAKSYCDPRSHREFVEFTGRGHFICGQDGWEEVALLTSHWLDSHLAARRA